MATSKELRRLKQQNQQTNYLGSTLLEGTGLLTGLFAQDDSVLKFMT